MKNCENCGNKNSGLYGSGRFCSSKCSRSFSTKSKRYEINKKVSKSLKNKGNGDILNECSYCKKEFKISWSKRKQIYCSRSCCTKKRFSGIKLTEEQKEKIRIGVKESYIKGKKVLGGKTKWYSYKSIKVQGTYELRTCKILDFWKNDGKIKDWEYTNDRIQYIFKNKKSTYILDFKVFTNDGSFYYIETKGYVTERDLAKWEAAKNNGFVMKIWLNKDILEHEILINGINH